MGLDAVHMTSAHPRADVRIYHKECQSLVAAGYKVTLVVADGLGSVASEPVPVIDVGRAKGRVGRMFLSAMRVFRVAINLDAKIYHLHDPELLPWGWLLTIIRPDAAVIFDAHEDVADQLLNKPYLTPILLRIIGFLYTWVERFLLLRFSGVVAATPAICRAYQRRGVSALTVCNFPKLQEFPEPKGDLMRRDRRIGYAGGICRIRGINESIRALELTLTKPLMMLAGVFTDSEEDVRSMHGWSQVEYLGELDRRGVGDMLSGCMAGLVTLHPIQNYLEALPVKMFEYMAAGVAVIASDFYLWREIVEGNDCGVCVNPLDSKAIADAIDYLMINPDRALEMGKNGRIAVVEKYNWDMEMTKLLDYYKCICAKINLL